MKKVTRPHRANESRNVFTEEIDYFAAGRNSVWGEPDPFVLAGLRSNDVRGVWLDVGAGDGRYTPFLLKQTDSVVASDVDEGALSKLSYRTLSALRRKLTVRAFDMTRGFPFKSGAFDGVFCAGILHLFPKKTLRRIATEITRVLRPGGRLVVSMPVDIRRISPEGTLLTFGAEPLYSKLEAEQALTNCFPRFQLQVRASEPSMHHYPNANPPYTFTSSVVVAVGVKMC